METIVNCQVPSYRSGLHLTSLKEDGERDYYTLERKRKAKL